jgi:hypothetical protein
MKRVFTLSGTRGLISVFLITLIPWMTVPALSAQTIPADNQRSPQDQRIPLERQENHLHKLTMNFSMMSPHVGQDLWLAVIDNQTMEEVEFSHHEEFTDIFEATGLDPHMEIPGLSVYPNPAARQLTVSTDQVPGGGTVAILDLAGHILLSQNLSQVEGSLDLDISQLPSGVYIIRLESGNHQRQVKFLKH